MKSVSFSITQVNRLRSAAVEARTLLAERPDPWPVRDADDLIRVFDTRWLKAGFALHAYDSGGSAREGLNNPHLGRNAIGCGSKIRFEDLSER